MTKRKGVLLHTIVCAVAGAVAGALACTLASVVHASAPDARANDSVSTVIKMDPIAPIAAGQAFMVTGILYRHIDGGNAAIPNRGVKLYIEPIVAPSGAISKTLLLATVFSDKAGRLKWVVRKQLESGRYRLYFLYQGSPMLRESFATTELVVSGALSSKPVDIPVQLSVDAPTAPIPAGDPVTITVRLTNKSKASLGNYNIYVRVPGATQQRETNADGLAVFVITKPLMPGNHTARIWFPGKNGFASTQKEVVFTVASPAQTMLTFAFANDQKIYVGDEHAFVAQLRTDGKPVPNQLVRFYFNGKQRYGSRTDRDGNAVVRLPQSIITGAHVVSATFRGNVGLVGSAGALPITVLPRPFEVHTMPPLRGVRIRIGETVIRTNKQGVARGLIDKGGTVFVTVLPYVSPDPTVRAEFDRWSDGVFSATRKIKVTGAVTATYQIGFEVSHPITQQFIEESSGRSVSTNRMNYIMLITSAGEAVTVTAKDGGMHWLKANRIIRLDESLAASPISYQVRNITIDGVNVVNEGQQRFKVSPNAQWTIKLQMHDLAVEVRDALFGFPMGKGMRVAYPMGQWRDVALDSSGRMRIESLSRGSYTVTVQGVFGIPAPTPIVLSRNQDVDVAVISYLDIGIVVGALTGIALCVLVVGRRTAFNRLRQRVWRGTSR